MAAMSITTSRPLNLTAPVVLKAVGALDPTSDAELRAAIAFALSKHGGAVVLDCAGLTSVDPASAETLVWFGAESRDGGRNAILRNVSDEVEQLLVTTGVRGRFDEATTPSA